MDQDFIFFRGGGGGGTRLYNKKCSTNKVNVGILNRQVCSCRFACYSS